MTLTHLILAGFTITWQGSEAELLSRVLAKSEKAYRVECAVSCEPATYIITPENILGMPIRDEPSPKGASCRLVELEFYQEEPRTLVRPRKPEDPKEKK